MPILFHRNTKSIKDIFDSFGKGLLIIDTSYQRRSIWVLQDKIRLIETILLDLVIPEVFFWPSNTDVSTGDTLTHIVDGQQRINSIVEFIDGKFKLEEKHLLDKEKGQKYCNKSFDKLDDSDKGKIWTYNLPVVNIDRQLTKEEITNMFYRLNLTNYSLNPQEKRHSKESVFGDEAEKLSNLNFWKDLRLFSFTDAKRMKDVEYCSTIYILAKEGITSQTDNKKINAYYEDYAEEFDKDYNLTEKIKEAMDIIEKLNDKTTISFISKKAQMYTLFCFSFKLMDNNINYSDEIFERFKLFVLAYNKFRNEFDIDFHDGNLRKINEEIKKYKLASSEGVNKVGNRVLRLEILYKICIDSQSNIKEFLKNLKNIYEQEKKKPKDATL